MTTAVQLETVNSDGTHNPVNSSFPLAVSVVTTSSSTNGTISAANSSLVNLTGAAAFTGTAVDMLPYGSVNVYVYSDQVSASGGLSVQQSNDGTNWFITDTYTISASTARVVQSPRQARFARVVYTNGATHTTTFILQTILNSAMTRVSAFKPVDAMSVENDADWSLSVNQIYNGTTLDLSREVANGANTVGTGIPASGIMAQFDDVSVTSITENSFGNLRMSADHVLYTTYTPTTSAGTAITPVVTSIAASNLVVKNSAGNLYGFNTTSGASAGYVMVFNATAAPIDGTVTPVKTYVLAANSSIEVLYNPPLRFSTGITLVFSTTGPFSKTASATAFLSGDGL